MHNRDIAAMSRVVSYAHTRSNFGGNEPFSLFTTAHPHPAPRTRTLVSERARLAMWAVMECVAALICRVGCLEPSHQPITWWRWHNQAVRHLAWPCPAADGIMTVPRGGKQHQQRHRSVALGALWDGLSNHFVPGAVPAHLSYRIHTYN
jgi:hypothetical protein